MQQSFKDAQRLQQQAERRKGAQAVGLYEQAATLYRGVLRNAPPPHPAEAQFALADCLQLWAESLLELAKDAPDAAAEAQTTQRALPLLHEAASLFAAAADHELDAETASDALVNRGNALGAAAALVQPPEAMPLFAQAVVAYRQALTRCPTDADALTNLADTLVNAAEVRADAGDRTTAQALYDDAMRAYHEACGCSSAHLGDDLPSLLHNWACGLLSKAQHLSGGDDGLPMQALLATLQDAATRLREAVGFARGDPAPLAALGDVHVALAELAPNDEDKAAALAAALQDGYQAALRVHAELARLMTGGRHWDACIEAYQAALALPQAELGGWEARRDVRYNLACALAMAGRVQEARGVLEPLLQEGGVRVEDARADEDLKAVWGVV